MDPVEARDVLLGEQVDSAERVPVDVLDPLVQLARSVSAKRTE